MTTIRKLTVGSLVGVTLTLGLGGIASAAPVSATGVPVSPTGVPGSPIGVTATSSPPSTPSSSPARTRVLTGREIWRIVQPHHRIDCAHAAKQLKKVQAADAAAGKRLARWQTKSAADQKRPAQNAATRNKQSSAMIRGFQKLQSEGQALIKRIESKCTPK